MNPTSAQRSLRVVDDDARRTVEPTIRPGIDFALIARRRSGDTRLTSWLPSWSITLPCQATSVVIFARIGRFSAGDENRRAGSGAPGDCFGRAPAIEVVEVSARKGEQVEGTCGLRGELVVVMWYSCRSIVRPSFAGHWSFAGQSEMDHRNRPTATSTRPMTTWSRSSILVQRKSLLGPPVASAGDRLVEIDRAEADVERRGSRRRCR